MLAKLTDPSLPFCSKGRPHLLSGDRVADKSATDVVELSLSSPNGILSRILDDFPPQSRDGQLSREMKKVA